MPSPIQPKSARGPRIRGLPRESSALLAYTVETEQIKARGRSLRTGPRDEAMRIARTCYDHIAGRLGVALSDRLVARGMIEFGDEAGVVTDA